MWTRYLTRCVCALSLTWAGLAVIPAAGQTRDVPPDAANQPRVDYDSEPPYTIYERAWNRRFAAPYRQQFRTEYYPYGRPYYPRRYASPYSGGLSRRGAYPYAHWDTGPEVFDEGYVGGFHDGRRFQQWQQKAELGLSSYVKAMEQGNVSFRNGQYGAAARHFILAAKLNQGDPASRLHVVHALMALGHYADAVPALRRALQLQPRLVYLPLDLRGQYGRPPEFAEHLAKLAAAAAEDPDDAGLWLLLGYCQFFSGAEPEAARSLGRAVELAPSDSIAGDLFQAARLSAPAERRAAEPTPPT